MTIERRVDRDKRGTYRHLVLRRSDNIVTHGIGLYTEPWAACMVLIAKRHEVMVSVSNVWPFVGVRYRDRRN